MYPHRNFQSHQQILKNNDCPHVVTTIDCENAFNEFQSRSHLSMFPQIFIDGQEMITGKLAGFVNGEVRALDSDGSSYFPPGDTNVFELSLWSNEVSGEVFTFKYYSTDDDIIIDVAKVM